jgi:serine/threonine-protein kinase RsbW
MRSDEGLVATARMTERATPGVDFVARRWVTAFAAEHGMGRRGRDSVAVAVSEAVTNAVRHAYPPDAVGDVELAAATDGEWLTVRVRDRGRGTESTSLGLGMPLMERLADRVEVGASEAGAGTVVVLEFPVDEATAGRGLRRLTRERQPA